MGHILCQVRRVFKEFVNVGRNHMNDSMHDVNRPASNQKKPLPAVVGRCR